MSPPDPLAGQRYQLQTGVRWGPWKGGEISVGGGEDIAFPTRAKSKLPPTAEVPQISQRMGDRQVQMLTFHS